jgi:hypothetical protein
MTRSLIFSLVAAAAFAETVTCRRAAMTALLEVLPGVASMLIQRREVPGRPVPRPVTRRATDRLKLPPPGVSSGGGCGCDADENATSAHNRKAADWMRQCFRDFPPCK